MTLTGLPFHEESLQSYMTLCDPVYCSLPGSSVHGILQTRILEWVIKPLNTVALSFLCQRFEKEATSNS